MRKNIIFSVVTVFVFIFSFANFAGTLFFKDGRKLSDVKIISITKGRITIEKGKVKKSFSVGKIKSYFDSDIDGGSDGDAFVDDFIDYKVTMQVDMPKFGESKHGEINNCDISYSIRRIYKKGKKVNDKRVNYPYFYLFVLTHGNQDSGGREIFMYYHPKKAKYKSKGYDQAAIISNLSKLDRPRVNFDRVNGYNIKKSTNNLGQREFKILLKKVKRRKILAYHIEVWGNKDIIGEKNWKDQGVKVAKRWWERY